MDPVPGVTQATAGVVKRQHVVRQCRIPSISVDTVDPEIVDFVVVDDRRIGVRSWLMPAP